MRFKKKLQYPGARRTRAGHHHGSVTPNSARAILHHTDQKGPKNLKASVDSDSYVWVTIFLSMTVTTENK